MQIKLIYDSSVNAAPAAFKTAMTAAASFLDELIANPITVNIQVGYGEDGNGAFPIGGNFSLGGAFYQSAVNYSTLKSDLAANATTVLDRLAVGTLPASDPTDGAIFNVGDAEARALGLLPATSTVMDGAIGFNETVPWNYNTVGQAVPGEFDFVSDAELELVHALGMQLGTPFGGSTPFMLFRYSAPGVRELTVNGDGLTTPPAYFSVDGGQTNLGNYLTNGDSTLFSAGGAIGVNDTLAAPYSPGLEHVFSPTDALEVNVLGFDVNVTADTDKEREPPKLTITDHSLSLSAGGTIPLPISVSPNDADDTVTVKISGVPSFDTITALDGHAVTKKGNSYTFTAADVQSGLTLTSSLNNYAGHEGEHAKDRSAAEQTKLTVTAFNTTPGEHAASNSQKITVTNTPNDLSYLMQLLNELQPKFLELITAHSRGGPTIEMETYGPQHVTAEFPPIEVTAPNGDPTTVSFSPNSLINDAYFLTLTAPPNPAPNSPFVTGPIPASDTASLSYFLISGVATHAAQLEVTKVTVTATDTVTDKSTSIAFNFIGFGQDKTLPPGSFPFGGGDTVIIPQGEVFDHYEQLLQSGSLNPGQSFQSLAALINQYAASFHTEHVGAGQMTSFPNKLGYQENLALLSNPHHHG